MIENVLNQFEYKKVKAGENLYNTDCLGNVLLFVIVGKLIIYNQSASPVSEVNEGNFVLLSGEKSYNIKTATPSETILMHAGTLSDSITKDPEWNPECPVVLPTFPSLAEILSQLKKYIEEKRKDLN
jgi:hypothetical protein